MVEPVASFAHAREGVALETQSSDHRAERAFSQLFCAVPVSQLVARATPSCIREQEWQYECKNSRMLCAGTLLRLPRLLFPPCVRPQSGCWIVRKVWKAVSSRGDGYSWHRCARFSPAT